MTDSYNAMHDNEMVKTRPPKIQHMDLGGMGLILNGI